MSPRRHETDDDRLERLAERVAAGEPVDWAAAAREFTPAEREVLAGLRELSRIVIAQAADPAARAAAAGGDGETTTPPLATATPRLWGNLRVLDRLGGGTYGEVYRAHDPALDRDVALKLLHPRQSPRCVVAALAEGRLLARVRHPNVVTVHGAEFRAGRVGIVMELVEGATSEDILAERGPWEPTETMILGLEVGRALVALHAADILHRDIKARNVMREVGGRSVLMDLGIGCRTPRLDSDGTRGTPLYAAPEVLLAHRASSRADLYAMAVLLFHLLTARYPVEGQTPEAVVAAHQVGQRQRLRELRPDLPASLVEIIERDLDPRPDARHASAADLVGDLASVLSRRSRTGFRSRGRGRSARAGIAILPLRDLSPRGDQAYFCEGLAEQIIHALSHVSGLRVLARSSAFALRERAEDPCEAARGLDCSHVLDGSVRRADERVRICVQLIETSGGDTRWSDQYDTVLQDVFAVQDEIARAIAEHLRGDLTPDALPARRGGRSAAEPAPIAQETPRSIQAQHPADPEACNLYLMGRFLFNRGSRGDLAAAVRRFQSAVARDPGYALAHVSLAEVSSYRFAYHDCQCHEHLDLARAAASRAVELVPALPEAHAIRGLVHLLDWQWESARQSIERALELHPDLAIAHHYHAHYLQAMGRLHEAQAAQERSVEADPVSHFAHGWLALFRFRAGCLTAGERPDLPAARPLQPDLARIIEGQSRVLAGDPRSGVAALERARQEVPEDRFLLASLGWAYGVAGRTRDARRVLAVLERDRTGQPLRPFLLAKVHAGLGDADQAFAWLARAVAEQDPLAIMMKSDATVASLREDPRFMELLARMGLE